MDMYKAERVDHDIPLDHFDYHYVSKCQDVKELEKILKVLRSGSLGAFPDLQKFVEQKLTSMAPKSKVLRKPEKLRNVKDLGSDEAKEILGDMENWTSDIKTAEGSLKTVVTNERSDDNLPPVRGAAEKISVQTDKVIPNEGKKNKKVLPRSYKEWDRIDVDAELAKVDNDEVKIKENKTSLRKSKKPNISTTVNTTGLTDEEKEKVAEREKNKGNEAFRSTDYDEALMYYNRSISVVPSIPAINNRAQTYVKLKKWDEAVKDCCTVLQEDKDNVKALLRRVVGLQGKQEFKKAKADLDHVLRLEPNNKRAQDLTTEIDASLAEEKKKGRRMVIVDEEGSDEEEDSEKKDSEKNIDAEEQSISDALNINKKSGKVLIEEMPEEDCGSEKRRSSSEKSPQKTNEKAPQKTNEKSSKKTNEKSSKKTKKSDQNTQEKAMKESEKSPSEENDKGKGSGLDDQIKQAKEEKAKMEEKIAQSKKEVQQAQAQLNKKKAELDTVNKSIDESISAVAPLPTKVETPTIERAPVAIPPALLKLKEEGKTFFTRGQYGEAAMKYTAVIDKLKKDPAQIENLSVIYSNRAACFAKTGESRKCVEDCSAALEITPGSLKPLIRRAQAYEAMERYDKAYVDYNQVLYIDSSIDVVLQGKNRCMKTLQDKHGLKWREKLPASQPITRGLASSRPIKKQDTVDIAQSVKSSQSENTSDKKDETSPQNGEKEFEKLNDEGRKFVQSGNFEKAAEKYSQCIRICPHKTTAYTNRALCHIKLNQPEKVLEDCNSALKLEPENIKALFRRAQAFKLLENYEDSKRDLERLLQLDPKNSSAKQELHQVNTHIENKKNAQKPEKKQKKIEILDVDDDSDDQEELEDRSTSQEIKPPRGGECEKASSEVHSSEEDQAKEIKNASTKSESSVNDQTDVMEGSNRENKTDKQKQEINREKQNCDKVLNKQATLSGKQDSAAQEGVSPPIAHGKIKTAYEFIQAWTSLKRCTEPGPYAKIVEQIEPQDLPTVISNKLDSTMLKMVIKCIEVFIDQGQLSQSLAYLQHLPSVPRFQVITLFMSSPEKADLGCILTKLEELGHCKYLTEDLRKLRKIYGLV